MPSLARVLESAEGRVERLPLLTLVAAPDAAGVARTLDAAGFDSHARVVARTVACLPEIRGLARRRRICGDCRLIVLVATDDASPDLQCRLVTTIDRSVRTTRFACVARRLTALNAQLRSRGVVATVPRRLGASGAAVERPEPAATEPDAAAVDALYDRAVAAGRSGKRVDVAMRAVAKKAGELAILHRDAAVVIRAFARAALRRGRVDIAGVAAHYAHELARAPQHELTCIQAFVIELVALADG